MKNRFTKEQIIGVLKEAETGVKAAERHLAGVLAVNLHLKLTH